MMAGCLVGCTPTTGQPVATPTESSTPTPSATPTATIVWFPPTPTFTPRPTQATNPTPQMLEPLGALLLSDDFEQPEAWELGSSARGNAAIGNQRLTVAVMQPRSLLFSLRKGPVLEEAYIEITASPNLCSGLDEYGLMFRVSSLGDFYRYSLSCNGQVRLDRVAGAVASSPQPWTVSGQAPPGAPGSVRLGVWIKGTEMRFFLNGEFQFSVRTPVLAGGVIGVFARTAGDKPLSVSFSELRIYSINP